MQIKTKILGCYDILCPDRYEHNKQYSRQKKGIKVRYADKNRDTVML
jgi:hypothetical protein